MIADFAHPHWAFIWPSYGLAIVVLAGLAFAGFRRAQFWARKARELDAEAAQAKAQDGSGA